MEKEIIIAKNSGFCFGVKKAVDIALDNKREEKIYTLGPIIHNNDVVTKLEDNNIFSVDLDEAMNLNEKDSIIIRSHGVGQDVYKKLKEKKLKVIDATCPYVVKIHKIVKKHYEDGYKIIIVGDKNHPEVIGINGWCENSAFITKDGSNLNKHEVSKVCVVAQTTERFENYRKTIEFLAKYSKELLCINTICSATQTRQKSAHEVSKEVQLMVVIGGKHSSNTNKLYEICKSNCSNTVFIENASELNKEMIKNLTYEKIGITAGASTPNWVIDEVITEIKKY